MNATLSTITVENTLKPLIVIILYWFLNHQAHAAGVNRSLDEFFDDLGYHTNVTNPSSYKGQSANYYNGGSLYVRAPIKSAQLVSATVPSISMGCGGIDAFMGGFSHINSDQLVQFGQAIVSNATPFAVDLALQTWAPQIKQIRDNLQDIADKWLNQSISSCETAQAAVSGLASAFDNPQTKKHICSTIGTHNNAFSDWLSAQQECGVGGQANSQLANARNNKALEDLTQTNHNIVWSATLNNGFLASDTALAEFLMSLSGTYIYDAQGQPRYYASLLADNNNLIQALLEGGEISYYRCDNTDRKQCLNLTKSRFTLASSKGLQARIRTLLEQLYTAIANDTELTQSQKSFLEYTETPIQAILISATRANQYPNFAAYSRLISIELLNRYLTSMLNIVQTSLANTQVPHQDIALITRDIDRAKRFTDGLTDKATRLVLEQQQLIQAHKSNDHQAWQNINQQLQQNLTFGE
ncbi:conjugal transfer protein TraH [Vibrio neptunius]|uniref:Conjugal transfer protein TraH n=1 Tax=Vibrio neptunius TaxID=170651 RepID=A0ABS3A8D5_9VIBR|nr:conjugal transfer protein TraH [Vibrio neptunius]MBN3495496.1 conjugal transfer protein TraH [Vibrio neptunius]MBN3517501.1 conjugal transfer protein TraH [Vibrio neptunius]MBN3551839.1 conjugal transfer protein TraH [Vibrio neptunius]MBN3580310.1 conjugal transfer protein TraH [Vibrio neptunius]MCH9873976.1 conjugal transfer protein TraH [Vibrio neptunius]